MNVNKVLTKEYENKTLGERGKNKAKQTQYKANLQNAQMNVNSFHTKEYENIANWALFENKANINPKQSQTKPIYRGVASGEDGSNPYCRKRTLASYRRIRPKLTTDDTLLREK